LLSSKDPSPKVFFDFVEGKAIYFQIYLFVTLGSEEKFSRCRCTIYSGKWCGQLK
jgi:hypothetical protein